MADLEDGHDEHVEASTDWSQVKRTPANQRRDADQIAFYMPTGETLPVMRPQVGDPVTFDGKKIGEVTSVNGRDFGIKINDATFEQIIGATTGPGLSIRSNAYPQLPAGLCGEKGAGLSGFGSCVFTPGHVGEHSWEA